MLAKFSQAWGGDGVNVEEYFKNLSPATADLQLRVLAGKARDSGRRQKKMEAQQAFGAPRFGARFENDRRVRCLAVLPVLVKNATLQSRSPDGKGWNFQDDFKVSLEFNQSRMLTLAVQFTGAEASRPHWEQTLQRRTTTRC